MGRNCLKVLRIRNKHVSLSAFCNYCGLCYLSVVLPCCRRTCVLRPNTLIIDLAHVAAVQSFLILSELFDIF